ncbi:MAG TPA: serine hydrolase [Sphingomicrobium sp.]|nr:serine hydrolase [Sphingomicrobium sp.]
MRRVAVLCWILALVAQPAWAASSPGLRPLEQQLAALVAAAPGDVGVAALDLKSGERVSINGDEPFPMASTVKIAIAANYLAQVEHGRRSLDDVIAGRSARSLIEAMMIRSDNHSTDLLMRDLGGPQTLQAWLGQHGLFGLRIDRNIAQLLRSKRDLRDVRDSATPQAMVTLLQKLDSGALLKPDSRSYLLDVMSRCKTGRNRIRALLPAWARVEHKTGTLSGYTSDVGFITLPDGRRIAVAFFARGGSNRARSIAEAARAIYDGFAATLRSSFTAALAPPERTWVLRPQP